MGLNYLLCAINFEWAILCVGFFENLRRVMEKEDKTFQPIPINFSAVVLGDYTVTFVHIELE